MTSLICAHAYLDWFEEEALVHRQRSLVAVLVVVETTLGAQQLLLLTAVVPVFRLCNNNKQQR